MMDVAPLRSLTYFGDGLQKQRLVVANATTDRLDKDRAARARIGKWTVNYFIRSTGERFAVQRRVMGLREFDQDFIVWSLEEARALVPCDFIPLPPWPNDQDDVVEIYG